MARDISVSIAVQGEKEFNQALKNAQSAVKVLASELKAGEAAFDENADAQSYYANRTRLINAQIEQEKTILASLEQAVREAANEFGEADAKTDKYRIALNRTYGEMAKLEKALRDTQKEAEELGRDSTRVGRQIENGIGEAAEDAADKLDDMVSQIERDMSDISRSVEFSALTDLGDMLKGSAELVISGVSDLTEGTLEYRRQMGILEQNAKDNGFDPEWLKQQAIGIAAITGDMDGALEAVSNLARVAPNMDAFTLAMNRMLGATIAWPETLKIENLAESLQESLASGQLTGAYGELMTRLKLDTETIDKSLKEATKKGEEAVWNAGTSWLSENGFEEAIKEFKEAQANLIAYNEAKLKVMDAEARLADIMTPAATAGLEMFAKVLDSAANLIESWELPTFLEGAADFIGGTGEERKGYIKEALDYLKNDYYVDWATSLWAPDELKPILLPSQIGETGEGESWKKVGETAAEETLSGYGEKIETGVKDWEENWRQSLKEIIEAGDPSEISIAYEEGIKKAFEYNNGYLALSLITEKEKAVKAAREAKAAVVNELDQPVEDAGEKKGGLWSSLIDRLIPKADAEGEDAAEGAVKELTDSVQKAADDNSENMSTIGKNMGVQIASGLTESEEDVAASALALWQRANDYLTQQIVMPSPKFDIDSYNYNGATLKGGGSGTIGVNHIELVAQIEKRTVARAVTDDVSARLGESAAYYSTYG